MYATYLDIFWYIINISQNVVFNLCRNDSCSEQYVCINVSLRKYQLWQHTYTHFPTVHESCSVITELWPTPLGTLSFTLTIKETAAQFYQLLRFN